MQSNSTKGRQPFNRAVKIGVVVASFALLSTGMNSSFGAAAPAKPKQLRMLYATAEANSEAVLTQVAKFKKKFGIDLKVDTMPFNALQAKVYSEVATNSNYYDIIIKDTSWMPTLAPKSQALCAYITNRALNKNALINIGDFIPKVFYDTDVYNVSDVTKRYPKSSEKPNCSRIKAAGFDVYGLPIQANALIMGYRIDLFNDPAQKAAYKAKYGKELAVPKTLADFSQVAKFFSQPTGGPNGGKLYGATMMAGVGDWSTDDFKSLLAAYGGKGDFLADNLKPNFNGPEGLAALTWYADLIKSGATPPGATSDSWDEITSEFGSGQTAMTWNYHTIALDAGVKGKVGYAEIPAGPKGDEGPHFGTWMLTINPNSVNKEWAYQAAAWFTAAPQQLDMAKKGLHVSRTSVYKKLAGDEFYPILGKALAKGVGRPRVKNYQPDISTAIAQGVNEAATGAKTPKQALDDAAAQVTKLLRSAGYKV